VRTFRITLDLALPENMAAPNHWDWPGILALPEAWRVKIRDCQLVSQDKPPAQRVGVDGIDAHKAMGDRT